jgi:hypothetical protein
MDNNTTSNASRNYLCRQQLEYDGIQRQAPAFSPNLEIFEVSAKRSDLMYTLQNMSPKNIRNTKATYTRALLVIWPDAAATASDSCVAFTCIKAFSHLKIKGLKDVGFGGSRD